MEFRLKAPCGNCPFRTDDARVRLPRERAEDIAEGIIDESLSFSCHKTNVWTESDDDLPSVQPQHCAGAAIFLENLERPNQWMRIAERLGRYDRSQLKMDSPVPKTRDEFLDLHDW